MVTNCGYDIKLLFIIIINIVVVLKKEGDIILKWQQKNSEREGVILTWRGPHTSNWCLEGPPSSLLIMPPYTAVPVVLYTG